MTDEEYARYSPWQQQMLAAEAAVSEAPAEVWLRPGPTWDSYSTTAFPDQPDAVRYVRADLHEALVARLAVLPSANSAYRTRQESE